MNDIDMTAFMMTQIFTVASVVLLVVAWVFWRRHRADDLRRKCHVYGIVEKNIAHRRFSDGHYKAAAYYPVVLYTSLDGKQVVSQSKYGTGSVKYKDGSKIDVWYDPENPEDFQTDNYNHYGVGPVMILCILALGFMMFGVIFGYMVLTGQMG